MERSQSTPIGPCCLICKHSIKEDQVKCKGSSPHYFHSHCHEKKHHMVNKCLHADCTHSLEEINNKIIGIIGIAGSGKTMIAKLISAHLHWKYVGLDTPDGMAKSAQDLLLQTLSIVKHSNIVFEGLTYTLPFTLPPSMRIPQPMVIFKLETDVESAVKRVKNRLPQRDSDKTYNVELAGYQWEDLTHNEAELRKHNIIVEVVKVENENHDKHVDIIMQKIRLYNRRLGRSSTI